MVYKIVHDTVHGSMKLGRMRLELIAVPEIQRLNHIKQLGLDYLVFPGANHSRLEHSLGTGHIACRMARELELSDDERDLVTAAGTLHDVGHGPFSHTLEGVIHEFAGVDHMEITQDIIRGKYDMALEGAEDLPWMKVPEILERHGVDPDTVAQLITGGLAESEKRIEYEEGMQHFSPEKNYLRQIIHGVVDADQIDYLLRDSHYTGVAHGSLDLDRLLQTIAVFNNDLVIDSKGVNAVEGMLVARALMYSSVYFHRTGRLAQLMMSRAVERLEDKSLLHRVHRMMDANLMEWLPQQGPFQKDITNRLVYRRLFKMTYMKREDELDEQQKLALAKFNDANYRRAKEDALCHRVGLDEGYVVIDVPLPQLLLSEPRIDKTEIKVLELDRLRPLSKYSPLSKAIAKRAVSRYVVTVACPKEKKEEVAKAAEKVLFE